MRAETRYQGAGGLRDRLKSQLTALGVERRLEPRESSAIWGSSKWCAAGLCSMHNKPLVFISSTSDLSATREALAKALRPIYEPYLYEEDRARGRTPEKQCRKVIDRSDVFLGLLGASYGTPFDPPKDNRSVVEWEYDVARTRDDLEIMMFISQATQTTTVDKRQQLFLRRITSFRGGAWCKFFTSTQELVKTARESLERWLVEFWAGVHASKRSRRHRLNLVVGFLAAGVICLLGLISALYLLSGFLTKTAMVGICVSSIIAILLCMCLLLSDT